MKTMHPTFSIIIPHKEIPDLLMRCLQSIPVSEDIQVIVVDDNSADADTYLERYPELSRPYLEFIRTTKGGGAGYARNGGLEHAKGKWLMFADADDFYVDDMYSIICSYVDSDADAIYFKKKSVLSEDISIITERCSHVNKNIDNFLSNGDEWPIRAQMYVPWGKMVKRDVMVKHDIRFDEVMYADDAYCSLQIGYYARTIQVVNRVLYVVTSRPDSQMSDFCLKPNELKLRAEAAFRMDKFMLQNDFCRKHRLKFFLNMMLMHDRSLFKFYFFRLEVIYPSKLSALRDISKGKSLRFKIKFYLYSIMVWARIL
jgi:glycosyltransferase involved in cell wall biosynthesis